MYDTSNVDSIAASLLDLTACFNSPRQDDLLLRAAGISLDRALFPLLVRLNAARSMSVSEVADSAGRDASTVSRQLAKLEKLGLVKRPMARADARVRAAEITRDGRRTLTAIAKARRRFLEGFLQDWSADERQTFADSLSRFTNAMWCGRPTNDGAHRTRARRDQNR